MNDPGSNPLIAEREDSTQWYSGVSLAESVAGVKDGIESGSWVEAGLNIAAAGIEVAVMVIDPIGTLAGFGVGFLIEHVQPLSDALDWVAGDPDQVNAYAKTWSNVATAMQETFDTHKAAVERDLAEFTGATATAYKARAAETSDALAAAVSAANAAASAISMAGGIVAAVRMVVRDLVAQAVGRLAVWAAEAVFSFGTALPLVAAQAAAFVAKTMVTISKLFAKVASTFAKLAPLLTKLKGIWQGITKALARTSRGGTPSTTVQGAKQTTPGETGTPSTPGETSPGTPSKPGDTATSPSSTGTPTKPSDTDSPSTLTGTQPPAKSTDPPGQPSAPTTPGTPGPPTGKPREAPATKPAGTPSKPGDTATKPSSTDSGTKPPATPPTKPGDTPEGTNPAGTKPPDNPAGKPESSKPVGDRAASDQGVGDKAKNDGPAANRTENQVTECGDPVDVATGEFLLPHTDLTLPGVLPLVLKRRHRSGYRHGRWFGPSWSATLDMRIVVEADTVTFLAEDGVLLTYPHPEPDRPVLPVNGGQRWTLSRAEAGGYRVHDPHRELTWHFTPADVLHGLDTQLGNYAITAITDRHHNRITFTYGPDGAPTQITHTGGYRVRIDTAHGRVTALTVLARPGIEHEIDTRIRAFTYEAGELVEVINGVRAATRFTYDLDHRMLTWSDSNGNTMLNTYDPHGRVVEQRATSGILDAAFTYGTDPASGYRYTQHTDSLGAQTTYFFDHDLNLRESVDAVGGRTHTEYDEGRRPTRITTPDGAVTAYRYNPTTGDPIEITRPDGLPLRITYHSPHRPATLTDVDGTTRRQEWSATGNLTATIAPGEIRTEYTHHPNGALATVTQSTGARTRTDIDPAGLPTRITDPHGAVTRIDRDHFGRPIRITDALGAVTEYLWSAESKLARRTDPDGHFEDWVYDGENNLTAHYNRNRALTRYSYGVFDLLASKTDPDGAVTSYEWDTQQRLTAVRNPLGHTWRYVYDRAGRLIAETDYNDATTRYTYAPSGRLATTTAATGITRHNAYDILGRLTTVTADTGDWLRYTHTLTGRTLTATSGFGDRTIHHLRFEHSDNGRLAAQYLDDRPPTTYTYDTHGRRTSRRIPSGSLTTWARDITGRVTEMHTDGRRIGFDHDELGRTTGWQIGTVNVERGYGPSGRLTHQAVTAGPDPQFIHRDDYEWRPDGFLTGQFTTSRDRTTSHREYALDPVGRITTITTDRAPTEHYTYDQLSNITGGGPVVAEPPAPNEGPQNRTTTGPPSAKFPRREYHRNLLIHDGRNRYFYDRAGRLIRKVTSRLSRKPDVWHYRYNAFDQLTDIQTPDGEWWHYSHDAYGRRVSKQQMTATGPSDVNVGYTWDGSQLIEQSMPRQKTRWCYRPRTHVAITQITEDANSVAEFRAILTDHIGLPVALADDISGKTVPTPRTTLWGSTQGGRNDRTPLRFPGQFRDNESGLHYNLHRVYDPDSGRYLTPDPLGLEPAANPSGYPYNPTKWADPLGLVPDSCDGGCINGGSWDPAEEPYLYRGVPHAGTTDSEVWQRAYSNAQQGIAEPVGGNRTAQQHVGGNDMTDSPFTSWTTDYEGVALEASREGNGPGVVLRIPNADGQGYSRVPDISFPYAESEVLIRGIVRGAEVSINGGPWTRLT